MRRVSIPQIGQPNIHRLDAAKNRRAPASALEETPTVGSAAVLGRINPTTDRMPSLDHPSAAPGHSPAGDAQTTCLSPYRHPGSPPHTSAAADWNKGQFAGHIAIRAQNPNNEPVTLSNSPPKLHSGEISGSGGPVNNAQRGTLNAQRSSGHLSLG